MKQIVNDIKVTFDTDWKTYVNTVDSEIVYDGKIGVDNGIGDLKKDCANIDKVVFTPFNINSVE